MTSGFCIGQCRYRHVVEGKTEVVSFSYLPWVPCNLTCLPVCGFIIIESPPSIVRFLWFLNMNLCAFSCDMGALSCKVDIRFLIEEMNFIWSSSWGSFSFLTFVCSHLSWVGKSGFVLCLGFCGGILSLIHFPTQATTGWPEARVGTNLGEMELCLLKQLVLRNHRILARRQIELSNQKYAVNTRINAYARSTH